MGVPVWKSLRLRLIMLVLVVAVPTSVLVIQEIRRHQSLSWRDIQSRVVEIARVSAAHQEQYFEGVRQLLIAVSRLYIELDCASKPCDAALDDLRSQFRRYANIGIVSPEGLVKAGAKPYKSGLDPADRPWLRDVMDRRQLTVGEYQIDRVTGKPVLPCLYPVLSPEGRVLAVISTSIDLEHLNDSITSIQLPVGATIVVLDRKGAVLARNPDPVRWLGRSMPDSALFRTILERHEGLAELPDLEGAPAVHAFTPVRVPGGKGEAAAFISVGIPTDQVHAEVRRAFVNNVGWLGAVALVSMVAAWLVGHFLIVRKVEHLTRAVGRMAEGDLEARSGLVYDGGEMGLLARSVDRMALALEARIRDLDHVEAALRVEDGILNRIMETTSSGIVALGTDGRIINANARAEELLGLRCETDLWHPLGALGSVVMDHAGNPIADEESVFTRVLAGGAHVFNVEQMIERPDGTTSRLLVSGAPVFTPDGEIDMVVVTFDDVTERIEAEQAVRISEGRYRTIFENSIDAIICMDDDGRILNANPAAIDLLGPVAQEIDGLTLDAVLEVSGPDLAGLLRGVSRGRRYLGEVALRDGEGRLVSCEMLAAAFRDGQGVGRKLLIIRDLSERRALEDELMQAREMKLVGQLASGVAHEVRNPLNAILSITEALFLDIGDKPGLQPYLEHMRNQVRRLSELMRDLLDLGKPLLSSNLAIEPLGQICSHAVDLWRETHPDARCRVVLDAAPEMDPVRVLVDPPRMTQVILNLLDNAEQHSQEGGAIEVGLRRRSGKFASIRISDQGTGIDAEHIDRVFEPFFTTRRGGTGLGLSLVHHFVTSMEGKVSISCNSPPPGCTAEVLLPVVESTNESEAGEEPKA